MSEAEELAERLRDVHSALDEALGDTDITHIESDEELRHEAPVQWAAMKLAFLIDQLRSPAREPEGTVPEGWQLVPKEPTDKMQIAAQDVRAIRAAYVAMLAASPAPPLSGEAARTALLEKVIARQALALMEIRTMQGDPIQIARTAMDEHALA